MTILSIITFAIYEYSSFDTEFFFIIIILLFLLFYLIYFLKKESKKILILTSFHQAFIYLVAVYYLVPKLDSFWIAKNMNKLIDNYIGVVDEVIHFGFNEPSLTFLTSHKAKKHQETYKLKNKKILYLVEKDFEDSTLDNNKFINFRLVDEIKGFNYSQGKTKLIRVYANF